MARGDYLILSLAVGLGILFAAITIGGSAMLFFWVGPMVESRWFPVLSQTGPTDQIWRTPQVSCFALHLHKNYAAIPLKYSFVIETTLISDQQTPIYPYIADEKHNHGRPDLENHPVGASWIRYYCFEIPAAIADFQEMRVVGYAKHERHPFWRSVSPMEPFNIAPLTQKQTTQ